MMHLLSILFLLQQLQEPEPLVHQGTAMGSSLEIQVTHPDQERCRQAIAAAVGEIDRLERMMTDWKPESPLMDVNRAAGKEAVAVPEDLFFLIHRCQQISELTHGAFDITWAGAGRLWNWRAPEPQVPDAETVRKALENVGWTHVALNEEKKTVHLTREGMLIGLGGIGPGYAGDLAMRKIQELGIRNAVVNLSGDVLLAGGKDGKPWPVSIAHPRRKDEVMAVIPVSNLAVSTSGDYERYFEKGGKRYCHIIDPRSGYPADQCQSVTIVAPTLAFADGLATGVFVLGPVEGMKLVESLEGVEALIVAADGAVTTSKGLATVRR